MACSNTIYSASSIHFLSLWTLLLGNRSEEVEVNRVFTHEGVRCHEDAEEHVDEDEEDDDTEDHKEYLPQPTATNKQ